MVQTDELAESARKHLEILNQKQSEVSAESNQFSNRFLFGGIVAVLALLNADLVIDKRINIQDLQPLTVAVFVAILLGLSAIYFYVVSERIRHFRRAYRSTKHKYEILLYWLTLGGTPESLVTHLEMSLKTKEGYPKCDLTNKPDFETAAKYLHHHHQDAFLKLSWARDWWMSMILVFFALVIRLGIMYATPK